MKQIVIIAKAAIVMTMFSNLSCLEAQTIVGLRSNASYRSFTEEIKVAVNKELQRQERTVMTASVVKPDFSSLGKYNIFPVRRLRLLKSIDSLHNVSGLEVDEPSLLILQPLPYKGPLFVYDIERHSIGALVDTRIYENGFQYADSSLLSFCFFLESEKYLGNIAMIADISGHSVSFLKYGSPQLVSLPELLHDRYGGLNEFKKRLQTEQDQANDKEAAFRNFIPARDAANFIHNSWQLRSKYLPTDTSGNIQLLLKDISTTLDIPVDGLQAVVPILNEHLRSKKVDPSLSPDQLGQMVLFMRKDISGDLSHILSSEQLGRYVRHLGVWKWQFKAVDSYVYISCLKGTYASLEEKRRAYDEYMRSFYSLPR